MRTDTEKGFTLIEILVSMGIIAAIGIVVSQTFFTTSRSNTKTELLKDVKQNGDYALGIMERMVRNARAISCSSYDAPIQSLTITNPDKDTTTFGCYQAGTTKISSTSGTGRSEYLTSETVSLGDTCTSSSLTFVCTTQASQPRSVTVSFTLSQRGSPPDKFEQSSAQFQSTVTLRND